MCFRPVRRECSHCLHLVLPAAKGWQQVPQEGLLHWVWSNTSAEPENCTFTVSAGSPAWPKPCLPAQTVVPHATMTQTWYLQEITQRSSHAGSCCAGCSRGIQDQPETHLCLHDMEQPLSNTCLCLLQELTADTFYFRADCRHSVQGLPGDCPFLQDMEQLSNTCLCMLHVLTAVTVSRGDPVPARPCRTWSSSSAMHAPASLS